MSKACQSMIHSRLQLGMKHHERAYRHTDIMLLEPDNQDTHIFLANIFSYRERHQMTEHAYPSTRLMLRSRKASLSAKLARHGISLNLSALDEPKRHLMEAPPAVTRVGRTITSLEEIMVDLAHNIAPRALLSGLP